MFDAGFQKPSFDGKGNTNVVLFCFLFFSYIMITQDPFLAGSSFVYSTISHPSASGYYLMLLLLVVLGDS